MADRREPAIHIILATVPFYGHVRPFRSLAGSLTARGFSVTFITGSAFAGGIKSIDGVEFLPLPSKADFDPDHLDEEFPSRVGKQGLELVIEDNTKIFFEPLPYQYDAVQSVLRRPELAESKIVILQDPVFTGTLPIMLKSPHARQVPVIMLGHFPLVLNSRDTAPYGTGLPSQGVEQNERLNAQVTEAFSGLNACTKHLLAPYDCADNLPDGFIFNTIVSLSDVYCQLCVPALEPIRSDLPNNVRFCGMLSGSNDKKPQPTWFEEFVVKQSAAGPLILVTSGTATNEVKDLILPTVEACRELPVRLVVCGVNIKQPHDLELPGNVRWAQWIAFEEIFPHTDVVVSNGGYGGISQALAAGIPMVLAGTTQEKTETNMRAAGTGAAVNLETQTPTVLQVREGLLKVLDEAKYTEMAKKLQKAYAECDAVGSIVSVIHELATK